MSDRNVHTKSKFNINARALFKTIYTETLSYSTVREANIQNNSVAIIYRLMQLFILAYVIG